jgi:hypothetical protein
MSGQTRTMGVAHPSSNDGVDYRVFFTPTCQSNLQPQYFIAMGFQFIQLLLQQYLKFIVFWHFFCICLRQVENLKTGEYLAQ